MAVCFNLANNDQLKNIGLPPRVRSAIIKRLQGDVDDYGRTPFGRMVFKSWRDVNHFLAGVFLWSRSEYLQTFDILEWAGEKRLDLDKLFTFKEPINEDQDILENSLRELNHVDRFDIWDIVDRRDELGGKFRSWREVSSIPGLRAQTVEELKDHFSMPVKLRDATEEQLRLVVGKRIARQLVEMLRGPNEDAVLLRIAQGGRIRFFPLAVADRLNKIFGTPICDLNDASRGLLQVVLTKIIANRVKWEREKNGPFYSWDDLHERVRGIGEKKIEALKHLFAIPQVVTWFNTMELASAACWK